jgi:hypothetical protein
MSEVEQWNFVESRFEDLDHQLEVAKKHTFHVKMDFESRFRVWKDQVIPDRVMQLKQHSSFSTAIRFYDLTVRDVVRLYRRATAEFMEVANNREVKQDELKFHQSLYIERQDLLYNVHEQYVNQMRDIIEG